MAKSKRRRKNPPKAGSRAAKRGARKAARTRARKHEIRVRAGRKAARTRARRHGKGRKTTRRRAPKRRSAKRRKHSRKRSRASVLKGVATRARRRKKLPEHMESHGVVYETKRRRRRRRKNPAAEAAEAPRRRRGKRRSRKASRRRSSAKRRAAPRRRRRTSYRRKRPGHRRHAVRGHRRRGSRGRRGTYVKRHMSHEEARRRRRKNPIDGWREMLAGVFGVASGYVIASGGDRWIMTHALTGSVVGGQANLTDTPPAGSIYNSEALSLPIWSSWARLGVAAASVGAPLLVAGWVRSAAWKSFFQLAGFGALARTAGKAADDGIAALAMKMPNPTLVRLYAPEMAAINAVASGQQAAAPAGTFARLLGRFLGDTVPASEAYANGCPPGYTLNPDQRTCSDGGNALPPPANASAPSPTPPVTYPPEGGGGGGSEPPYTPPTPPSGGASPVTPTVPVSTPARGPFNPLLCSPDPDPC